MAVVCCLTKQFYFFMCFIFGLIYYLALDLSLFWSFVASLFSPVLLFILVLLYMELCYRYCDGAPANQDYNRSVSSPPAPALGGNNSDVGRPTAVDVFTIETDDNRTSLSRDNSNINSLRVGSSLVDSNNTANDSSSTNSLAQMLQRSLEESEIERREFTFPPLF